MKYEVTSLNTKKMFVSSLKKIMVTKPFSKITVSEIIRDCGVNRKTFYYHFTDIYDLLKWMFEEEAVEVVKQLDVSAGIEQAIAFALDYIEQNDHIINCAYDSIGREGMKNFLMNDFFMFAESFIDRMEKKEGVFLDKDYKKFLVKYYAGSVADSLIDWLKDEKGKNKQKFIAYLTNTIQNSLKGIMEQEKNK